MQWKAATSSGPRTFPIFKVGMFFGFDVWISESLIRLNFNQAFNIPT
jgi:hypothetical protein